MDTNNIGSAIMSNMTRYEKDRASVMSMIKFILITSITFVLVYFSTKVVAVLIPFLIGFILAKTSFAIALPFSKFDKTDSKTIINKHLTLSQRKQGFWFKFTHPDGYKPPKSSKTIIAIYVYVLLLIILVIATVAGILSLISQGSTAIERLSELATNTNFSSIVDLVHSLLEGLSVENGGFITSEMMSVIDENVINFTNSAIAAIPTIVSSVGSWILDTIQSLPYAIFAIICVILSGYYFINDGPEVMKFYLKSIPNKSFRKKSLSLLNDLSVTLFRVLGGYTSLLVITLVESLIIFKIAGVEYAFILALVTALLDFLPVLGISATMIPIIVYCFASGNYFGVAVIIIGMAIMTVIRRIIEPIILGKSMHVHPLLMLLGMTLGVFIWGPIGFLLGPTVMIIIIQVIKVFEIDKKISSFLSKILSKFMKSPEEDDDEDNGEDLNKRKNSYFDKSEAIKKAAKESSNVVL